MRQHIYCFGQRGLGEKGEVMEEKVVDYTSNTLQVVALLSTEK